MGSISEGPNGLLGEGVKVWVADVVQAVGLWLQELAGKDQPSYTKSISN